MKKNKDVLKSNNQDLIFRSLSRLFPNIIVFTVVGYCYFLNKNDVDTYYALMQEDDIIEWATMWSFLLASFSAGVGVYLGQRKFKKLEWFYAGLALFCFLIAMEEISWGQRFFGYLPPNYFLENNFQQELTVHNIVEAPFRAFILKAILLGYGVILPFLMLIPRVGKVSTKFRVIIPPVWLIPSFYLAYFMFKKYPWVLTGELVELMMGLSFLYTILFRICDFSFKSEKTHDKWLFYSILVATGVTIILGLVTVNYQENKTVGNSKLENSCFAELKGVKNDFVKGSTQQGFLSPKKQFHHRLYTLVNNYNLSWMYQGEFSTIVKQDGVNERAKYFLDPWNMPYWVMYKFDNSRKRKRFVIYSFGPNRKRDSSDWLIKGDDIGVTLFETK